MALLLPFAALSGLAEVAVVGLISRLFTVVAGQPNRPVLPFTEFIPDDPKTKVIALIVLYIGMNWISSFLKILLKISQERLRVQVWLDLSKLAQSNILAQSYEFFINKKNNDYRN